MQRKMLILLLVYVSIGFNAIVDDGGSDVSDAVVANDECYDEAWK